MTSVLDSTLADLDEICQGEDINKDFQKHADTIAEMRHQVTVIDNVLQSAAVSTYRSTPAYIYFPNSTLVEGYDSIIACEIIFENL